MTQPSDAAPDARSRDARSGTGSVGASRNGHAGRARIGDSALAQRLRSELEGEVLFDAFSRGHYATDASIW